VDCRGQGALAHDQREGQAKAFDFNFSVFIRVPSLAICKSKVSLACGLAALCFTY
jgi:hypothetical protein